MSKEWAVSASHYSEFKRVDLTYDGYLVISMLKYEDAEYTGIDKATSQKGHWYLSRDDDGSKHHPIPNIALMDFFLQLLEVPNKYSAENDEPYTYREFYNE